MTMTYRAGTTASATLGTDDGLTINVPAGTSNGDGMVLIIVFQNAGETAPGGLSAWNADTQINGDGADISVYAYYRIASSEPASYSPTWTNARASACMISFYDDAAGTVTFDTSGVSTYASGTTHTNSAVTAGHANSFVVSVYGANEGSSRSYTASTLTERQEVASTVSLPGSMISADPQASSGTTGNKDGTYSGSVTGAGGILVFYAIANATIKTLAALGVGT